MHKLDLLLNFYSITTQSLSLTRILGEEAKVH